MKTQEETIRKFLKIVLETYRKLYGTDPELIKNARFFKLQLAKEAKALAEGFEDFKAPLSDYLRELDKLL